jgi:hypothetical protein
MSNESAVAQSIAAAGKRVESMSVLCEILSGQIERQRMELLEIKAAIAPPQGQPERGGGAPGDISPEMLV